MKEIKNKDNKDNKDNNNIIVMENMSDDSSDRTPPKVRITKQDIEAVFENEDGGANWKECMKILKEMGF